MTETRPIRASPFAPDDTRVVDGGEVDNPASSARIPSGVLIVGTMIDVLAVAILSTGSSQPLPAMAALALHLVAAGTLLMDERLEGSRRTLALCLVLCLPPVGTLLAALALGTQGRAGLTGVTSTDAPEPLAPDSEAIRRIGEAPPVCEALLESDTEERQTILAALIRRKDADAVELLRWLAAGDQQLAVEAALALEELSVSFESELDRHRAGLAADPSPEAALRAGVCVSQAIESGIVDVTLIDSLTTEARHYFEMGRECDAGSGHAVAAAWARLEIAAMHPDVALDLLNRTLAAAGADRAPGELTALREEARFASHALLSFDSLVEPAPTVRVAAPGIEVDLAS